jgi:two-component system, sensor histidine kinase and response regulator
VKTIVVVDDEPGYCETVKEILEDEGYAVELARDGRAGLELLRGLTTPPCLVLLDLIMPELDGGEVYRALQADPVLSGLRVVVATSDPSRAPAGAAVVAKPMSLDQLLELVRACCAE